MTKRKYVKKKDRENALLEQINAEAIDEYKHRQSKWTSHDLREIKPITEPQRQVMEGYIQGNNIVCSGSPGTGKTLIALYLAMNDILQQDSPRKKLLIVKSATPSKEIGFLPGDIKAKTEILELPYIDLINYLFKSNKAYESMVNHGLIQFTTTSYIRGLTWSKMIVLYDEAQNSTLQEISSVIGRTGKDTKLIVIGDMFQNDLVSKKYEVSGFDSFLKIAHEMSEFDIVNFTSDDIVRSSLVKSYLKAYERVIGRL